MVISKKTNFPRFQRGIQLFSRGGGGAMLISIETHIACDFPGGGGVRTPYSPSGSAHVMYYTPPQF